MPEWSQLLCNERFGDLLGRPKQLDKPAVPTFAQGQFRLAQERDHDRILFSTPFRRMGDKTQVFPLESIESIRTRLTHSYEVANLARSLGIEIATSLEKELPADAVRTIPAILAAAGLAHDIGNPPFGHQGEDAIRAWFKRNSQKLFYPAKNEKNQFVISDINRLTSQHKNDFLKFEGNAQTLRVLSKLQVIGDDLGLNLTIGTLAASMKYISASNSTDSNKSARKKVGYFASEQSLVKTLRAKTGLEGDARHPLALVMEACDDIAYSVLDAEDAIKKGIVSLNDLIASLEDPSEKTEPIVDYLCQISRWELNELRGQKLHPSELQDVATQKFRVHAIHIMVCAVAKAFRDNYSEIMDGTFDTDLIDKSEVSELCRRLKKFDRDNAFGHKSVLEVELNGYNKINRLMDFLWIGITERQDFRDPSSRRKSPFAAYVYGRISKNYRRIFEEKVKFYHDKENVPIRYKEMQLLTDMISGMTDQFCIDLHQELEKHYSEFQ